MITYRNCTELNVVYPGGVTKHHPAYSENLDRDHDGVACEQDGFMPESWVTSPTASSSVSPSPSASPSVSARPSASASSHASTTTGPQLPLTGPGEGFLVGGGLLAVGVLVALAVRRRRVRFQA